MSNSPFQSKEAEKAVMTYVQDELFPAINEIKDFNEKIFDTKENFFTKFYNPKLNKLVGEYQSVNKKFFEAYTKFTTPDTLFSGVENKDNPALMADYFNWQNVVQKQLDEGFKLLEIGDRRLDSKLNIVDQNFSRLLALLAIIISIATAFYF